MARKKKGRKGKWEKRRSLEDEYPQSFSLDSVMNRIVAEMYSRRDMFLVAQLNEPQKVKHHVCQIMIHFRIIMFIMMNRVNLLLILTWRCTARYLMAEIFF